MSGFPILDLVIGLVFIYFLLSIISSSAVEIFLTLLKARAKILEEWLKRIFDKKIKQKDGTEITLGQAIMDHCAAIALSKPGKAPSYIDAKNFTAALFEKITYNEQDPKSIATNINDVIKILENTTILSTEIRRALLAYAYEAKDTYAALSVKTISEIEYFKLKIEAWYDTSMDRLTGTFKRTYSQPFTFIVALIVAVSLNADSISIAKYLYTNPDVNARIVEQAVQSAKDSTLIKSLDQIRIVTKQDSLTLQQIENNVNKSVDLSRIAKANLEGDIPLGWNQKSDSINANTITFSKVVGLLATVLAIFMGAPFWFDILNKIANLRGTGPKPPSSTDKDDDKK